MKKTIRLTESELITVIKKVISEDLIGRPSVSPSNLERRPDNQKDEREGKTYTTKNQNVMTFDKGGSVSALTGDKITIPAGTVFTYTLSKFKNDPNYAIAKIPDVINSRGGQKRSVTIKWTCSGLEATFEGGGNGVLVRGTSQYLHQTLRNLFCKY
jgi:hypothetical protein